MIVIALTDKASNLNGTTLQLFKMNRLNLANRMVAGICEKSLQKVKGGFKYIYIYIVIKSKEY